MKQREKKREKGREETKCGSKKLREGARREVSKRRVLFVRNVARAGVCPSHVLKHWRNHPLIRYACEIVCQNNC